jgi:hypothetical protein
MNPANFPTNKARKQKEALQRNEAWQKLTPAEQLRDLDLRPGASLKQRLRIREASLSA